MANKFIVGRAINGVTINGNEYLLDQRDEPMLFESENDAVHFLQAHGCTEEEIASYAINPA